MAVISALVERAILEPRKRRKPNFSNTNNLWRDPKKRLLFIIILVVSIVALLFIIGLVMYGRKEWNRKKEGKKPRWGRVLFKAFALATFLWIPIWIVKKIRNRKGKKGSYNKLDEAGAMQQPQAQWYGGSGKEGGSSGAYVGAGAALHGEQPATAYGLNASYYSGQDLSRDPNSPYDTTGYGHGAVPTGYVAPRYDPPASLPDDVGRRSVSPAPPYQAPPYIPPGATDGAPMMQGESGAWGPTKG